VSIEYAPDFKAAQAVVMATRSIPAEGFMGHPVKAKALSRWKLENGQWCYYVDPQKDMPVSPFARFLPPGMAPPAAGVPPGARALPPLPPGAAQGAPPGAPGGPPAPRPGPIPTALRVDKTALELKAAGPSSGQVTISNSTPFPQTLSLADPKAPGLEVKLDRVNLNPGEKAVLSVQWSGGAEAAPRATGIVVTVERTGQRIQIPVSFAK